MYFNPRLREGGDNVGVTTTQEMLISIHASAREATYQPPKVGREPDISIHASAREATAPHITTGNPTDYFNPRLREGGDADAPNAVLTQIFISIHASAREATLFLLYCFVMVIFQSTPPRGRRRNPSARRACEGYFNPRLREGGDTDSVFHLLIA